MKRTVAEMSSQDNTNSDASTTRLSKRPKFMDGNSDTNTSGKSVTSIEFDVEKNPARVFPFELDGFQKDAIKCLERGENVLVTAHTSAGKTVVAEYAIALALAQNQRVIYTSPIKALSNQKYRDFQNAFSKYKGEIGLMTGDVTKNLNASCLVMTTEILRNFLYKGHELLREVKYVIFDEVHYMKDKERGVIWEESIILLNQDIQLIFLSATISNAKDFSSWVQHVKGGKPCTVVSTTHRPVPLEHYVFPPGSEGLYLIQDKKGRFLTDNFKLSRKSFDLSPRECQRQEKMHKNGFTDLYRLLDLLRIQGDLPAMVFSFSRKEVEHRAFQLSGLNLNTKKEQEMVEMVFNNAIDLLSQDDRNLTAIQALLPMLKRGIGVHHSGLLPILKEITEILFGEGLIKVLFATETFAMGVNMPAKVVIFSSLQKFDGLENRWLHSGEYTQMSGRAGRRGLDKRGICIMMSKMELTEKVVQTMIKGDSNPLNSSFRLTYNMVLNLKQVDFASATQLIDKSFYHYILNAAVPQCIRTQEKLEHWIKKFEQRPDFKQMHNYFSMDNLKQDIFNKTIRKWVVDPRVLIGFLQPGRLVQIEVEGEDWGWGIVVNYQRRHCPDKFFVDVLVRIDHIEESGALRIPHVKKKEVPKSFLEDKLEEKKSKSNEKIIIDLTDGDTSEIPMEVGDSEDERDADAKKNEMQSSRSKEKHEPQRKDNDRCEVVRFMTKCVKQIGLPRMRMPGMRDRLTEDVCRGLLDEVKKQYTDDGVPPIPVFELPIDRVAEDKEIREVRVQLEELDEKVKQHPWRWENDEHRQDCRRDYQFYLNTKRQLDENQSEIDKTASGKFKEELVNKGKVLRQLGYLDDDDTLTPKGVFGCSIESVDELVITELVFEGVFNELTMEESVAFLSAFLPHGKSECKTRLSEALKNAFEKLTLKAKKLQLIQVEAKVDINAKSYLGQFKDNMIMIVLAWVQGKTFRECTDMTNDFEGNIVRMFRRIEELLRQLIDAVKSTGNEELVAKFTQGQFAITRGIAFAASLYIGEEDQRDEDDEGVADGSSYDDDDDDDEDDGDESDYEEAVPDDDDRSESDHTDDKSD